MDPQTIGASALILVPAVITVRYVLVCWLKPFVACKRCAGGGTKRTTILRRQRRCWRCYGTGRHLRAGRVVFNAGRRFGQDAR